MKVSFRSQNPVVPFQTNKKNKTLPSEYQDVYTFSKFTQTPVVYTYDYKITGNKSIDMALRELRKIQFSKEDVEYLKKLGVTPGFRNGEDAYDLITKNKIKIDFGKLCNEDAHAQWMLDENRILINEKYKNTNDFAEILALSESLMHEAGHVFNKDGNSSKKEELDCLAMNALATRYHQKVYPGVLESAKNSPVIQDGVLLYEQLFFEDNNPSKTALANRINSKYDYLPFADRYHPQPKKMTPFLNALKHPSNNC